MCSAQFWTDAHHFEARQRYAPRMTAPFPFELSDRCVKCGLCLPHCPTYRLSQKESEGPRGRIAIMESVASGQIDWGDGAKQHLNNCLGCARCETVCPAKVDYLEIRDRHRSQHLTRVRRWRAYWLSRPSNKLFALTLRILQSISRTVPRSWLPKIVRPMHAAASTARLGPLRSRPSLHHPTPVAELFRGCVASAVDLAALQAASAVLAQLEHPVLPSRKSYCCGALAQHEGHLDLAKKQRETLAKGSSTPLVALDSGCIADLRRSGRTTHEVCRYLLDHWPHSWQFSDLHRDSTALQKVALHLPCTHQNTVGDTDAVIELLQRIPQIQLHTVHGLGCCGAGGMHGLDSPEHAAEFSKRLLAELPTDTDVLLSTNIGCRIQLRTQAPNLNIKHPVELLRDALASLNLHKSRSKP